MAKKVTLKPHHQLLNPDFDGYKLSSGDDVTVYSYSLREGVQKKKDYSSCYLRTKLEALHNHLFHDPFHPHDVYYFSGQGHLVRCSYSEDMNLSGGDVVWQAEVTAGSEEEGGSSDQHYPSLHFPAADLAVVTNGQGNLHILETGDRATSHSWLMSFEVNTDKGVIVNSRLKEQTGQEKELHCLLLCVTTPQKITADPKYTVTDEALEKTKSSSVHLIHWLTLSFNGTAWEDSRHRAIAGEGTLEYCALDEGCAGVTLLCHKNYSFVTDSVQPVTKPESTSHKQEDKPKVLYMQNDEDVTVWLSVGSVSKKDLDVKITTQELSIQVQQRVVLKGVFQHIIKADLATWTLSDGKLELVCPKATEKVQWPTLFESQDESCEEIMDPEMVETVHQRLAHLTSDEWNPCPDLEKPAYDPGQLEDCDQAGEDLVLVRLDGTSHQQSSLGQLGATQHLFNCQVGESSVLAFSIRHDVDAVLWQPSAEDQFTHIATYNAFGYVKASKTMAKFTCSAADFSYVAVADVRSHIYVFFQPEAFSGELRNRKSGKRVDTVARQLVISMKTHDEILGLHASHNILFVITEKTLYAYCLHSNN